MVSTNELVPNIDSNNDNHITRYASFEESLARFGEMYSLEDVEKTFSEDFNENEQALFEATSIEELDAIEAESIPEEPTETPTPPHDETSPLTPQETRLVAEVAALPAVESRTRRSRLRNWCGRLATRAYFRSMDMAAAPAAGYRKGNTALETRFAATETDGRLKRFGKALGRHALKAVAYTAGAVAGGAYLYSLGREVHSVVASATTDTRTIHTQIKDMADVTILAPGRGDKTGDLEQQMLENTGMLTGRVEKIQSPAGVLPIVDPTTADQTRDIVAPEIVGKVNNALDHKETANLIVYSNDNFGANKALAEIRAQHGGKLPNGLEVIRLGDPTGSLPIPGSKGSDVSHGGVLRNPMISGVAHVFGITNNASNNRSGEINVTNWDDYMGNGANPSLGSIISSVTGPGHNYSQAVIGNAPVTMVHNVDGSVTAVLGPSAPGVPAHKGASPIMSILNQTPGFKGSTATEQAQAAVTTHKPGVLTTQKVVKQPLVAHRNANISPYGAPKPAVHKVTTHLSTDITPKKTITKIMNYHPPVHHPVPRKK